MLTRRPRWMEGKSKARQGKLPREEFVRKNYLDFDVTIVPSIVPRLTVGGRRWRLQTGPE